MIILTFRLIWNSAGTKLIVFLSYESLWLTKGSRQQGKIILKINLSSFTNRSSPRALINYVFVRLRLVTSMVSKCALLDLRTNTETQVTWVLATINVSIQNSQISLIGSHIWLNINKKLYLNKTSPQNYYLGTFNFLNLTKF